MGLYVPKLQQLNKSQIVGALDKKLEIIDCFEQFVYKLNVGYRTDYLDILNKINLLDLQNSLENLILDITLVGSEGSSGSYISKVELVDQTLHIIQDSANGSSSTKQADLSKFITEEEITEGLTVSDGKVSSNAGTIKTTEDIPVIGGPLSGLLTASGIKTIKAETDLQSLLLSLFTKEEWPTPVYQQASLKSTAEFPPAYKLLPNRLIAEVNSTISLPEVLPLTILLNCKVSVASNLKISGLTYGYASSLTGTRNTATEIVQEVDSSNISPTSAITVNRTIKGVKESVGASYFTNTSFTVDFGTNSLLLDINLPEYTAYCGSISSEYYYYSNLLSLDEDHKTAVQVLGNAVAEAHTVSKNITYVGVYPIYYIKESNATTYTKLGLTDKTDNIELNLGASGNTGTKKFAIASIYTASKIELYNKFDAANPWVDVTDRFTSSTDEENFKAGEVVTPYKVYTISSPEGAQTYRITLTAVS